MSGMGVAGRTIVTGGSSGIGAAGVEAATARSGPVTGLVVDHGVRGEYVSAFGLDLDRMRRLYDLHAVWSISVSREASDGSTARTVPSRSSRRRPHTAAGRTGSTQCLPVDGGWTAVGA